jgi:hypothetical protein
MRPGTRPTALADPQDPTKTAFVERRRRPRRAEEATSWEQVALQRIAGRVNALPGPGSTGDGEAADFGWERAVLERLRRRLDEG